MTRPMVVVARHGDGRRGISGYPEVGCGAGADGKGEEGVWRGVWVHREMRGATGKLTVARARPEESGGLPAAGLSGGGHGATRGERYGIRKGRRSSEEG